MSKQYRFGNILITKNYFESNCQRNRIINPHQTFPLFISAYKKPICQISSHQTSTVWRFYYNENFLLNGRTDARTDGIEPRVSCVEFSLKSTYLPNIKPSGFTFLKIRVNKKLFCADGLWIEPDVQTEGSVPKVSPHCWPSIPKLRSIAHNVLAISCKEFAERRINGQKYLDFNFDRIYAD